MPEFMPVTAENIVKTLPLFREAKGNLCDDTAGVTWQWRNLFETHLVMAPDALITRSRFPIAGVCYSVPVGTGGFEALFEAAERDAEERNDTLRFACVSEEGLGLLMSRYGGRVKAEKIRSWADYLYTPENFEYRGKHLHGQRNHVNRFYALHPEAVPEPVTEENEAETLAFLDKVVADHPEMTAWERGEAEGTKDLLLLRETLGQTALVLRIETGIAAFSMGEVKDGILYVHAEKADTAVPGSYPAMAQAFARYAAAGCAFVNREDDAGDEGIRTSKEQYRPALMAEKYLVTVE